jgi:AcrR family transcriptional regulator
MLACVNRRAADVRLDDILRAACDVIAERGLGNTRTSDVAQAAGVSQALMFYHFETKERLLAQAFAWAAEQDLARLDTLLNEDAPPLQKLRKLLRWYAPTGSSKSWAMWIDCWAESQRVPELEKVSRRLDLRWKEALSEVITLGVKDGDFACDDPLAAAWRVMALIDGLAVQVTVHPRMLSRKQLLEWVRVATARELNLDPSTLI